MVVSGQTWVLGTELEFSARASAAQSLPQFSVQLNTVALFTNQLSRWLSKPSLDKVTRMSSEKARGEVTIVTTLRTVPRELGMVVYTCEPSI